MWQDNEIRFDSAFSDIQPQLGENVIDRFHLTEDTKGNPGDIGKLIISNLRVVWHSISLARINLSIGFNTFVSVNTKTIHTILQSYTRALYILASYKGCRYEFLFTNSDPKCTRHFTSVMGVYRAYLSSKIYREIKLRSGIINDNRLVLLPQERIHDTLQDVWNLSFEQGNIGTLIVTNIRLVWFADMNQQFNVSLPYLAVANISIRSSKFGVSLVIATTELNGGYVLGFRIDPPEKLYVTKKEISAFLTAFEKSPILGVEYTYEHEAPSRQETPKEQYCEIEDNNLEISNVFGYYFSEEGNCRRKPSFSDHLGLAAEESREGSTLQSTWELVPSA